MVTIEEVTAWLATLPAEQIVYFDSFEPRHCLMAAYFTAKGHEGAVSEYDRSIAGKKVLAPYTPDVTEMTYSLHFTPLRYTPTASRLRAYIGAGRWTAPQTTLFALPDEEFNALYESEARPQGVAWQHIDHVEYEQTTYRVLLRVMAPSPTFQADYARSLPYGITVFSDAPRTDFQRLRVRHHHRDGRKGYGAFEPAERRGSSWVRYDLSCIGGLAAGEYVEVYGGRTDRSFATYTSENGRLVRRQEESKAI